MVLVTVGLGVGVGGLSVMGGADEQSCNADCGDLKQHRFEHSWGSQQRCTKCRLRCVHRGRPYVAPSWNQIFFTVCLQVFMLAINTKIRKCVYHLPTWMDGWMNRDMKGSH